MPKIREDPLLLQDISLATQKVRKYVQDLNYEQFEIDEKTQDAVVRNLEIIGEAAKNISEEFRSKYPQINWRGMIGMRIKISHHYFGTSVKIVWDTIQQDLPVLLAQLHEILGNEPSLKFPAKAAKPGAKPAGKPAKK